jgi:hypothetical protein
VARQGEVRRSPTGSPARRRLVSGLRVHAAGRHEPRPCEPGNRRPRQSDAWSGRSCHGRRASRGPATGGTARADSRVDARAAGRSTQYPRQLPAHQCPGRNAGCSAGRQRIRLGFARVGRSSGQVDRPLGGCRQRQVGCQAAAGITSGSAGTAHRDNREFAKFSAVEEARTVETDFQA